MCVPNDYALPLETAADSGLGPFTLVVARDHFSFLGSLFSFEEFFLHFEEQYQNVVASFLTYIMPMPSAMDLPQNEHFLLMYDNARNQIPLFLLDLPCFTFGFSQHEHVAHSNRPLDVTRQNPASIFTFQKLDADLSNLACHASATDDLNDFSRSHSLFCFGAQVYSTP